ncbi:anti-sigma factor antagonist [Streptomyces sp. LP11]|uniref:Anti-sigma factor antagonist n=1 Tax=Streptomyces pyxinicus TaxID=2970331 RepID=A0ABT2BAE5_9ACTN|nr:anti-sigma factor antagonist [Streptomyces sp. LP11]MCS0605474.1 anti-sigma factor antagonist [Streptomyces sp. LP11]
MRDDSAPRTRQLRVYEHRGHTVLELLGEIDLVAAAEIGPALDLVTRRAGARIVLDLRQVEFFDCSGLRLVYRARARVLEHGGRLHLVCTHPMTLRVFRVTGLSRLLPPYPTPDAALAGAEAASGTL